MDCCRLQPEYVDAQDVISYYGRWQAPDEDKAATKHRAEHVHHDFFNVWACRVRDLKEFGVGHMMYFTFLWWMAALFCVLAVLVSGPNIAINLAGKYFESGQLEFTTLGNFGRVSTAHSYDGPSSLVTTATGWELEHATSMAFTGDAALPAATWPFDKAAAVIAVSVVDCIGAAVYFVVTLGLIVLARRRAAEADTVTVTIHDYSVYVRKLPPDASSGELVDFFSQWGEVEGVELVRAYGRMLKLVLARGKLLQQLQSAIAALQQAADAHTSVPAALESACHDVKEKVAKVDAEIQAEQALGGTARVVGAFVTFRNESSKLTCLKVTPHSWIKQWWSLKPQHKFRGRYALHINESPEPSDVQYENMEHSALARAGRTFITACCSYTALALGFFFISLATASRINVARMAGINLDSCTACRLTVGGVPGLSDADRALYASCDSTGVDPQGGACRDAEKPCYKCYCYTSLTSGRLSDSSYCSNAIGLLALDYSSQIGVVLAILGINMLLAFTSRHLTLFEKHHTRSSEARTLAHRLFLAQFLNSAVSTIIANAHLPLLANLLDGTALAGIFFQGIYTDLTPNWYKVVGRSLLISQILAAVLRVCYLLMRWAAAWWAHLKRGSCRTQEELESSLRGPEFLLDHRYGEHLSVIYVSMLLSGAMPIAFVSAAFWFVTSYWCDKVELLKLSRRPVTYGNALSDHVMNLLPYAAVWHVAFALWAFSLFGVGQSRLVTPGFASIVQKACSATEQLWEAVTGLASGQVVQRLLAGNAAHLLVALIVMVGVLFMKLTLTTWIKAGHWLLNMAGLVADAEDTQQTGAPEFPVAVRTQLLVGETSYAIQDQPAYAAAFTKMEHMEEDVCVKVVLKGRSRKQRTSSGDGSCAKQHSPRSQVLLGGQLCSPPRTASTVAAASSMQPPAGQQTEPAVTGASTPLQAGYTNSAPASIDSATNRFTNEEQHTSSRPNTTGSSCHSRSTHGSRRGSNSAYPAIGRDNAVGMVGFEAAVGPQQAITLGQLQLLQDAGLRSARAPGTAEIHQHISQEYQPSYASTAAAASAEGGIASVGAGVNLPPPLADPPAQLSAAQRFRQARANRVVPIPEEYLIAPRPQ